MREEYFTDLKALDYLYSVKSKTRYDVVRICDSGALDLKKMGTDEVYTVFNHKSIVLEDIGRLKNFGYCGTGKRLHVGIKPMGRMFKRVRKIHSGSLENKVA